MVDLIDIDDVDSLQLRAEVVATLESPAARTAATTAITEVLSATPEVTEAPWWKPDWITDTVNRAPARFHEAADRWRTLYREALNDLDQANKVLKEIGASEPAKRGARARIIEARAALDLLRGQVDDIAQSDFYPYRYFASEGFLPGYSFPRLPLSAFIPADRKTKNGQGDYVQRPRFVAISEFGPGAFIYHEGARYEVDRVSLPTRDDGGGVNITEIKRCNICGYLHENTAGVELCQHCGSGSLETLPTMMRLTAVKTRRRDRISADEEERQRAGYELVTSIRFVPHGERAGQVSATITVDDTPLGTMTYGDTALIRRMNVGLRRRKDKHLKGYLLDTLEGRWAKEADLTKNTPGQEPRIRPVIPYVEDRRNAMMVELDPSINEDQRRALMYALKRAIETVYQLESSELAVEPLPGHTGDHAWSRLLFFEAAEGGAGVLRRVATEDGQLRLVARKALELLHFNPDTGQDQHRAQYAREDCAQACYDCLLSYSNQWDHQHLDRHTVTELLQRLMRARTETPPDEQTPDDQYQNLAAASNSLESQFLTVLTTHGYRLPDDAQQMVDGYYVRPDFAYHTGGMDVAVFLDGPIHDGEYQQQKDDKARAKLEDEARLAGAAVQLHRRRRRVAHNHRGPSGCVRHRKDRRMTAPTFPPGTLVRARGRDWLVIPGGTDGMLRARPLGGSDAETTLLLAEFDDPTPAVFAPPTVDDRGDASRARLLRDGLRLSFQATGGPFRSFAKIAVTPRNYQLVPLMMATAQDTTRLLIADGVGIGKTVEAGLIVAELLATGDAERLAVLCSPQLAPQWRAELQTKFGIDAHLLLPSTVNRLQRSVPFGSSIYQHYPYLVISTDFIKQHSRRDEFAVHCPELVIVDEAHTCVGASSTAKHSQAQLRYTLLRKLADDPTRHLLLLTATPHSGDDEAWQSLIGLLDPRLTELPADLSGRDREEDRKLLAQFMIQRQRADIREYLDEDTPFPDRESTETSYTLTPAYKDLFDDVMAFVRKEVDDPTIEHRAPPGAVVVGDRAAALPGLQPGRRRTDPAQPLGAGHRRQHPRDRRAGRTPHPGHRPRRHHRRRRHRLRLGHRRTGYTHHCDPAAAAAVGLCSSSSQGPGQRRETQEADPPAAEAACRGLPPDRVLPLHPHRRLPRRTSHRRADQKESGPARRGGDRHPAARRAGTARRPASPTTTGRGC